MTGKHTNGRTSLSMVEVIVTVAFLYFLGGSNAPAYMWAIITVFAVWVALMTERQMAKLISSEDYERWKTRVGLIMVVVLLASPLWVGSWWPLLFGLILGLMLFKDLKNLRGIRNHRSSK